MLCYCTTGDQHAKSKCALFHDTNSSPNIVDPQTQKSSYQVLTDALQQWDALLSDAVDAMQLPRPPPTEQCTVTQAVVDAVMGLAAGAPWRASGLWFVSGLLAAGRAAVAPQHLFPLLQFLAQGPWPGHVGDPPHDMQVCAAWVGCVLMVVDV